MEDTQKPQQNLYNRRFNKESAVTEDEIKARMRWDMPVLSSNPKCSVSLDLPLLNCQPTSLCAQVCYAAQGRQYYRKSVVKALAVDRLIELDSEHVARKMVDESAGRNIRIAGSGEILPSHAPLLSYVERFGGNWWGMTRRVDTHQALPTLMFSIDATTPAPIMQYVAEKVTVHGQLTNYTSKVPLHETDCPVDRKEMEGCWSCKRCY